MQIPFLYNMCFIPYCQDTSWVYIIYIVKVFVIGRLVQS